MRADQPADTLRQPYRRDRHADRGEPGAAGGVHRGRSGGGERLVRAGERQPVDHHELAGVSWYVHSLPQGHDAEQAAGTVLPEPPYQQRQGLLALQQDLQRRPRAQDLRGALGRAPGGEEPEGTPAERGHQPDQFLGGGVGQPGDAGPGQVRGNVQDALLLVRERRPDVQRPPRCGLVAALGVPGQAERVRDRVELAAQCQRGRGRHHGAVGVEVVGQDPGHRQRRHHQRGPALPLHPRHVVLVLGEQALHRVRLLVQDRSGLLLADRVRVVRLDLPDRVQAGPGRRVEQGARLAQRLRQPGGEPARRRPGEGVRDRFGGLAERFVRLGRQVAAGPASVPFHHVRHQLCLGRRGDPVGQLVGLVHNEQLVRRHDLPAGEHVHREQAVVGHHDVHLAGAGPGRVGETLRAVRAAGRPDTLPRRHRHQPPSLVVDARVQLVAIPGLGLHGPVPQPFDLLRQPALLPHPQRLLRRLILGGLLQPGQAQIVVASFEDGEGGPPAEQRLDRLDQARQVVLDELGLQRQGGGGDHHRAVHQQGRGEVRQGLAGAGAGLDQQVLA